MSAAGEAIYGFREAMLRLRESLAPNAPFAAELFAGIEAWTPLLDCKLAGADTGPASLIVSIAGGTNTGKSTLFNLLLNGEVSAVRSTAAATCRPLAAMNPALAEACLAGRVLPGFAPQRAGHAEQTLDRDLDAETLLVTATAAVPEGFVFMDTPDVDSIDRANWGIANRLRAASDVVVAVLTAEKYQDDKVIQFFREAHALGRVVLPVMNKADSANGYEVARAQLAEFIKATHLVQPPCFVVEHDFAMAGNYRAGRVRALDGSGTLREYIEGLDIAATREAVLAATLKRLLFHAEDFAERCEEYAERLRRLKEEFDERAERISKRFEPLPGAAVGGLFHEFVQSKRGRIDRAIGDASRVVTKGATIVGSTVSRMVRSRASLEHVRRDDTEAQLREKHSRQVEQLAQELAAGFFDSVRNLDPAVSGLVAQGLSRLDVDAAAGCVSAATVKASGVSDDFRRHAEGLLERWWQDHRGKRMVIEALDRILLVAPAGIAGVLSVQTAGIGLPEAMIVAGPFVEQFAARVMEYQFGDAMFDFISPWRKEQQEALARALREHVAHPALDDALRALDALEDEPMAELRRTLNQCRQASLKR